MMGTEQLVLACECGATLKCSDLDGVTRLASERIWRDIHGDHEQVTCQEAMKIRTNENALRRRAKKWWNGDDKAPTTGKFKGVRSESR